MRLQLDSTIEVVGEAADGQAALDLSALLSPDVILLDLNLPGMNGLDVCAALSQLQFPVVLFSLDDGQPTQTRCVDAGAVSFVSKRASARQLLQELHGARSATKLRARRRDRLGNYKACS
jgi:CheY-like chemotaxis protein